MKEPILKMSHISKVFYSDKTGEIPAVTDVSLDIQEGECVGIVGESGCGKSTIARMITGITGVTDGDSPRLSHVHPQVFPNEALMPSLSQAYEP